MEINNLTQPVSPKFGFVPVVSLSPCCAQSSPIDTFFKTSTDTKIKEWVRLRGSKYSKLLKAVQNQIKNPDSLASTPLFSTLKLYGNLNDPLAIAGTIAPKMALFGDNDVIYDPLSLMYKPNVLKKLPNIAKYFLVDNAMKKVSTLEAPKLISEPDAQNMLDNLRDLLEHPGPNEDGLGGLPHAKWEKDEVTFFWVHPDVLHLRDNPDKKTFQALSNSQYRKGEYQQLTASHPIGKGPTEANRDGHIHPWTLVYLSKDKDTADETCYDNPLHAIEPDVTVV